MVRRVSFGAAIVAAALVLAGCAPGVQPLLDEYNALFGSVTLADGSDGRQDEGWLRDYYDVTITNNTLNLHAPRGWETYTWKLEPYPGMDNLKEEPLPSDFNIEKYIDQDTRSWLKLDLVDAGIKSGTYKLTSTISKGGETLSDWCRIIISMEEQGKQP